MLKFMILTMDLSWSMTPLKIGDIITNCWHFGVFEEHNDWQGSIYHMSCC